MVRVYLSVMAMVAMLVGLGLDASAQMPTPAPKDTKATTSAVVVNLNTASAAELEALPGIGIRVAERIVEYRKQKGSFKKIEELMNVQGIGEKSFLRLRPQITVGAAKPDNAQQ